MKFWFMGVCRHYLLEAHDGEGKTPLMRAVENGDLVMVAFLINMGADVNTSTLHTKRTPLMLAVYQGRLEVARLLCDKDARVDLRDVNNLNILHYAVDKNSLPNVNFALEHVADVDLKDNSGWTPLMRGSV